MGRRGGQKQEKKKVENHMSNMEEEESLEVVEEKVQTSRQSKKIEEAKDVDIPKRVTRNSSRKQPEIEKEDKRKKKQDEDIEEEEEEDQPQKKKKTVPQKKKANKPQKIQKKGKNVTTKKSKAIEEEEDDENYEESSEDGDDKDDSFSEESDVTSSSTESEFENSDIEKEVKKKGRIQSSNARKQHKEEESDEDNGIEIQNNRPQRAMRVTRAARRVVSMPVNNKETNEESSSDSEASAASEKSVEGVGSSNWRKYRDPRELLSTFARIKENREKKTAAEKNNNNKPSSEVDSNSQRKTKRSREEFEEDQRADYLSMPKLNVDAWPKYIGTIQFKAKVQIEFFGYMRKVEFIMLKRWANKQASSLTRGDPLLVDYRAIDEARGKNKTLSLQASRLHANVANINKEIIGVFEHNGCEIWNFLGYRDFVTLKLFCMSPFDDDNHIDGNKAFDVLMDVYLNESFVANPLTLADFLQDQTKEQQEGDDDIESSEKDKKKAKEQTKKQPKKGKKEESDDEDEDSSDNDNSDIEEIKEKEKKPKGKKIIKKTEMTQNDLIVEWEFNYLRYMKEVIPQLFDLMHLKRTIPSLIKQKKGNEGKLMKMLALKRHHSTLPAQLVLKSEEMREYYSHCPEVLERASPLYLLKEQEIEKAKQRKSLGDNEFSDDEDQSKASEVDQFERNDYGNVNENTRESLGLADADVKEKEELTEEEALKLNEKLSNIKESQFFCMQPTPKNMCTHLFDYQQQGLSWLMYREGRLPKQELFKHHPEHFTEDRELNSFYEEITLPDSTKIYHNVFSAEISRSFVPAQHTFGGILADQMGLGKTLMSLALIHSDLAECRKQAVSGTLLVLPLTCLGQWQREITKHSFNDTIKILNYHEKESREANLNEYDVILCPYNLLGSEFSENPKGTLFKKKWHRVILDEAQKIKNSKSAIAKAAFQLDAQYRWALTGTPIENKLDDLFSLLKFLRVETFGEWFWWNSYINQQVSRNDKFDLLHQILKPLILRRTKLSQDKEGKVILELPKKSIHVELVKLTAGEQKLYNLLHSGSRSILEEMSGNKANTSLGSNYMHVFQMICKLRQFCVHPSLVFKDIDASKLTNISAIKSKVDAFLDKYRSLGDDTKDANLSQSKKKVTNNSKISSEYRNELIQNIKKGEFKNCLVCFDDITVHSLSVCGHILCNSCFHQSVRVQQACPICRHPLTLHDLCDIIIPEGDDVEEEQKDMNFNDINKLSGSKVKRIIEIIQNIHEKKEKVVVFTQWITLINILDEHLLSRDIPFERIEGSVKAADKDKILRRFEKQAANSKRDENVTVLLASMKSASVGLNLVAANHVILCDPWWNPAVEDQAMERVHRIGQTKEVEVWRMICAGTIEEKVLELHKQKREMIDNALACTDAERRNGALSELQFLLN